MAMGKKGKSKCFNAHTKWGTSVSGKSFATESAASHSGEMPRSEREGGKKMKKGKR